MSEFISPFNKEKQMKYLRAGEVDKRRSKTNLSKGCFGVLHNKRNQSMKVIRKSLRTKENCNNCGVAL